MTETSPRPRNRPSPIGLESDIAGRALLALAADVAGRTGLARPARHVCAYLMHVAFGVTLTRLARLTERDRSTLRYACRRVEDLRDDAAADRALDAAETALHHFAQRFLTGPSGRPA